MQRGRTSLSYIGTFNYHLPKDREIINSFRAYLRDVFGPQYRIKLQGRLGVNNSAAAKYRAKKDYKIIALNDSGYVDAYVYHTDRSNLGSHRLSDVAALIANNIYFISLRQKLGRSHLTHYNKI